MNSSYQKDDVILLLKDITGLVKPQPTKERERLIQSGKHYCEMLPIEYVPTKEYMTAYEDALKNYAKPTAAAVETLADKLMQVKGEKMVLVSLARAGIPIGILLKRCLKKKYYIDVPHYSISIIRGRGIDKNAMNYLLNHFTSDQLQFVDGWIGKGAILKELEKDLADYPDVSKELAVIADPANITDLCGTHEDILIPSSCLNCTVSGLISRTFLRDDIIKENDFHGAVYYKELQDSDLSYDFIHAIEQHFGNATPFSEITLSNTDNGTAPSFEKNSAITKDLSTASKGIDEVRKIADIYDIDDINLIKPGIGEATRVLLRRVPWKVLLKESEKDDPSLNHIKRLANEKGVPVETYPLTHYKACGIIKKMSDV